MSLSEADLVALYQRVYALKLRIQKTPQVTSWISDEAQRLAVPLTAVERKLKQRPRGAQQRAHLENELLQVQQALRTLFREHLNPLMGGASDEPALQSDYGRE